MKIPFSFIYLLTQRRVDLHRDGGWRFDHAGDLVVNGVAWQLPDAEDETGAYEFDIDEILYEGTNIFPVLETFDSLDNIEAACYHHIHHLFIGEPSDYEVPALFTPISTPGKLITLPLRRKVK